MSDLLISEKPTAERTVKFRAYSNYSNVRLWKCGSCIALLDLRFLWLDLTQSSSHLPFGRLRQKTQLKSNKKCGLKWISSKNDFLFFFFPTTKRRSRAGEWNFWAFELATRSSSCVLGLCTFRVNRKTFRKYFCFLPWCVQPSALFNGSEFDLKF